MKSEQRERLERLTQDFEDAAARAAVGRDKRRRNEYPIPQLVIGKCRAFGVSNLWAVWSCVLQAQRTTGMWFEQALDMILDAAARQPIAFDSVYVREVKPRKRRKVRSFLDKKREPWRK